MAQSGRLCPGIRTSWMQIGLYHGAVQSVGSWIAGPGGVLVGAIIGALGAIAGGLVGAWLIGRRDEARRLVEHKAAVRAVLLELLGNLATVGTCKHFGRPKEMAIVTTAYSSLLVPLFSHRMPEDVASDVGKAYAQLMLADKAQSKWELFLGGEEYYDKAFNALGTYAWRTLGISIVVSQDGSDSDVAE